MRTQCHKRRSRSPRSSLPMPHAPLPLPSVLFAPQHAHSASLSYAGPHTPLPPPAVTSQHAQRFFPVQGLHSFLGRPFFLPTCSVLRRAPHLLAHTHVRTRMHGRPTNERGHPQHSNGNSHMALGDRRSENTTTGSARGCSRGRQPRLGLRCDAAISRYNKEKNPFYYYYYYVFLRAAQKIMKMTPPFSLIPKAFGHV